MSITILASDSETCVGRCHGSENGLCPAARDGKVYCAGLRLRVEAVSPRARSWTFAVQDDATSCPVWLGGGAGALR